MFDSCSTGTFITEDAIKQLEAKGTDIKVLMQTMNGPRLHDFKVLIGLVVSDLNGDNSIELPKTFTRDEIPGTETEIPCLELYYKWQHLKCVAEQVPPYMTDVKIGLLIGTNCPKAIESKDFVANKNGGPCFNLCGSDNGWTTLHI